MISDNAWGLLDWQYVCSQAPGVATKHEHASDSAEYGVNFFEFIETEEGLTKDVEKWWKGLSEDERLKILEEKAACVRNILDDLEIEIGNANVQQGDL